MNDITERRLAQAMDKFQHHHPRSALNMRAKWDATYPLPTAEQCLREVMDRLADTNRQIAGRLRTVWRREDEARAEGKELPPDLETLLLNDEPAPSTPWQRFVDYWRR